MTDEIQQGREGDWRGEESWGSAVRRSAGFLALVVIGLVVTHFTPHGGKLTIESIEAFGRNLGSWGPLFILVAGILTPILLLPRWPLAFLGGLLYGVTLGTALAVVSSGLGATLHFYLSRTLLAPMSKRILARYKLDRFKVGKDKQFLTILLMRAFPLSSFVATNIMAGALRMHSGRFIFATLLGMIPSTLMYASWGKLMKKPDASFYVLAVVTLLLVIGGSVIASRWIKAWHRKDES